MKIELVLVTAAAAGLLGGCATPPPWAGPEGTVAHYMTVEASPPGARIETNGQIAGETPITLKIFCNRDGTFHDFGYDFYILRALPLATNQFVQTRYFGTGRNYARKDKIPEHLFIDMNQPQPAPVYWPQYGYPSYSPPVYYYSPWYYGPWYPYYPYYYYGRRVYVSPHRHW